MDNTSTTLRGVTPPRTRVPERSRAIVLVPPVPPRLLAWVFLAANLLAVAAVSAATWRTMPPMVLASWVTFTVINAVAVALMHVRDGAAVGRWRHLERALVACLGLAWSGGVLLAVPHAAGAGLGVVLGAACGLAAVALPVLGNERTTYTAFVLALSLPAIAALTFDGRHLQVLPWLVLAAATLLLAGQLQARNVAALRLRLQRFVLAGAAPATAHPALLPASDVELLRLAELRLATQAEDARHAAAPARVLGALGEAVVGTDAAGLIDYLNPLAEALLGLTAAGARGRAVDDAFSVLHPPQTANQVRALFERAREGGVQTGPETAQLTRRDGVVFGIDYTVSAMCREDGSFSGSVFLLRDVTERRQRNEITTWQATHDLLTGAINRGEFEVRLKKLLHRSQAQAAHAHCLLCIDVDRFKFINDTYGHAAGDYALKTLGEILRARIRGADTLARIGGDEFAALLYSCTADRARLIAEGLRSAVEKHRFEWQSVHLPLSISIGLAEVGGNTRGATELLRAADAACYRAKALGRNRVQVADGRLEPAVAGQDLRLDLIKELQDAIHGSRLELYYQPLVALGAATTAQQCQLSVGMHTRDGTFLAGDALHATAGRFHLSQDIDRWTVQVALDALRLDHPALASMALVLIPLSAASCADDRLLERILRTLKDNPDLAPRVGFVIEDATVIAGREHARYYLALLEQLGCRLMLSDLGFGSAAIALAKTLRADFLGLHAGLVEAVLASSVDYEVVLSLARVARSLGMQTVAERADSVPLRDALARMGVDFVKGQPQQPAHRVALYDQTQWV